MGKVYATEGQASAAGASAAGAIGGAAVSGLFGIMQQQISRNITAEDRRENYEYGEKAAENADQRTRALYEDFYSPKALLKQYKEAGLSPSMMFGGTPGQGGMSGAQAAGASGPQTTFVPASLIEGAQIANLIAQTRKTNAEADTEEGKNQKGKLILQNLSVGINNQNLQGELLALEGMFKQVDYTIKTETAESVIQYNKYQVQQIEETVKAIKIDNTINSETQEEKIQIIRNTVLQQQADIMLKKSENNLKKAQVRLTNDQCKKILNDIVVDNIHINNETKQYYLNESQLQQQVHQWCELNNFKDKDQQIAIKGMILNFITENAKTGIKALSLFK